MKEREKKYAIEFFVFVCFSLEPFFKKRIIKAFMFSNLAWVKVTKV